MLELLQSERIKGVVYFLNRMIMLMHIGQEPL